MCDMYRLKTIADFHVSGLITDTILPYVADTMGYGILAVITDDMTNDPRILTEKSYWDKILKVLEQNIDEAKLKAKGIGKTDCMSQKASYLKAVRFLCEYQFEKLSRGGYRVLYSEGTGTTPLCSEANRTGIRTVFLDRENPAYDEMDKTQRLLDADLNRKRELLWLEKIDVSPELEHSLLVVGRKHVLNEWGFVDELTKRNVELEITGDMQKLFELFLLGQTTSSTTSVDAKIQKYILERKTNRNDPCPCSSGKKYKKCCGVC